MQTIFRTTVGAAVAGIAVIGLVAGCGSDGEAVKAADSSATTNADSPADPSRVRALVLTPKDFPTGYVVQEIPAAQMKAALDQLRSSTAAATITPASCKQVSAIPTSADLDKIGLVTASRQVTSTLTESVVVGGASISDYRRQLAGECANLSLTMDVQGQKVVSTVEQTVVDGPKVDADDAIVVELVTKAQVAGQSVTTKTLIGAAEVKGYSVSVQSMDMTPGGSPDRAAFEALYAKAVEKVQAQG